MREALGEIVGNLYGGYIRQGLRRQRASQGSYESRNQQNRSYQQKNSDRYAGRTVDGAHHGLGIGSDQHNNSARKTRQLTAAQAQGLNTVP